MTEVQEKREKRGKPAGAGTMAAAGFLLAWAAILFALAAAIRGIAGNGDLLAREMLRHAPPETTGLPETEYAGVGRMTAAWLTGREGTFQYVFTDAEGTSRVCFQPHEAAHMEDCRELIRLAGRIRWIAGGAALALAGAAALRRRDRKRFAGGILRGLAAAGAGLGALLIWGLIDFDGLFVAFHKVAFTGDGWLLDARTDLLLRLMPTRFFISLGTRVLAWTAGAACAIACAAAAVRAAGRVKREK